MGEMFGRKVHHCCSVRNVFLCCFCACGFSMYPARKKSCVCVLPSAAREPAQVSRTSYHVLAYIFIMRCNAVRLSKSKARFHQYHSAIPSFSSVTLRVKGIPGLAATGHDSTSFRQDVSPTARMALAKSLPQAVRGLLPRGEGALTPLLLSPYVQQSRIL